MDQYFRKRIQILLFYGLVAIGVVVVAIPSMSLYTSYETRNLSDNMIRDVLDSPRPDFMSANNIIADGEETVKQAATEIRPAMSSSDIQDMTESFRVQHLSEEQIEKRLADYAGTSRLRRVNEMLLNAANRLDAAFSSLARCYQEAKCGPGTQFSRLCDAVDGIQRNINAINAAARAIPRVNFNDSGTVAPLSNGFLDVYFEAVRSKSVVYLSHDVCGKT